MSSTSDSTNPSDESFRFSERQTIDDLNLQAGFDGRVGKDPLRSLLGLTVGLPFLYRFF